MKLLRFLEHKNISQAEFADMTGLSVATVSLLARDLVWLSRESAMRIGEATKGKVTANDFVYPQEWVRRWYGRTKRSE